MLIQHACIHATDVCWLSQLCRMVITLKHVDHASFTEAQAGVWMLKLMVLHEVAYAQSKA